jgi:ferredoxin
LAPNAFKLHGEEALLYNPSPDDSEREQVLRAAAACPVQAILVELPDVSGKKGSTGL